MTLVFWIAAAIAVLATAMVITRLNAIHALLYLIVSLLAVAVVFLVLGAPFVAALEVMVYAGAIMVLFVFVVMLLNLGQEAVAQERGWLDRGIWVGPSGLALLLLLLLAWVMTRGETQPAGATVVTPKHVGAALFGPYLLGVELAGLLLLGALVGAFHLGRQDSRGAEQGP